MERSTCQLPDIGRHRWLLRDFMRIFAGKGAVVAALALGGLTSVLTWRYVDQASQNAHNVEMVPVVVAAMPISARTVLAPEMLRIQRMPVDTVDPLAAQSAEDVVGKVARAAWSRLVITSTLSVSSRRPTRLAPKRRRRRSPRWCCRT